MTEMLDNRSFDESEAVVTDEKIGDENTDVQASEDTADVAPQEEKSQETPNEPDVEETTEKTNEEKPEQTGDAEAQKEEPSQQGVPRAQKRIKKLLDENKALREQFTSTRAEIGQNANGEIEMTPDQLNEIISSRVQETLLIEKEKQMAEEKSRLWDEDIKELISEDPALNPDSDKFDKELNDALIDLIRAANTDDNGNPVVRKLPSEIYATMRKTINSAKSAGKSEASVNLANRSEESAVHNSVSTEADTPKYSDKDLAKLQRENPRKYNELVENNLI